MLSRYRLEKKWTRSDELFAYYGAIVLRKHSASQLLVGVHLRLLQKQDRVVPHLNTTRTCHKRLGLEGVLSTQELGKFVVVFVVVFYLSGCIQWKYLITVPLPNCFSDHPYFCCLAGENITSTSLDLMSYFKAFTEYLAGMEKYSSWFFLKSDSVPPRWSGFLGE